MKIEKVIEELQKIHAEFGNLDVRWWDGANEEGENIRVCVDEEEVRGELTREEVRGELTREEALAIVKDEYLVNEIYNIGKFLVGNKGTGRMIAYIVGD